MKDQIPFRISPMLATLVPKPFNNPGWVYEEKYDGIRMLAYKEGRRVRLLSRLGKDRTSQFPDIAGALCALPASTLLLDGEIVIFDRKRVSRFQLLQRNDGDPAYAVFDCLYCNGIDLRREPLVLRRKCLEEGLQPANRVLLPSHLLGHDGLKAFRFAQRHGYEGILAKSPSSPYVEGRSSYWLKMKVHQEDEFVIVGYTQPAGSRQYIGALLLAAHHRGKLECVGKVGTGFDQAVLAALHEKLQPLARPKPPCVDPPREKGMVFVAPRLIAQISFQEWTADRKLRQPVFLGLRDDKRPQEVLLPETA